MYFKEFVSPHSVSYPMDLMHAGLHICRMCRFDAQCRFWSQKFRGVLRGCETPWGLPVPQDLLRFAEKLEVSLRSFWKAFWGEKRPPPTSEGFLEAFERHFWFLRFPTYTEVQLHLSAEMEEENQMSVGRTFQEKEAVWEKLHRWKTLAYKTCSTFYCYLILQNEILENAFQVQLKLPDWGKEFPCSNTEKSKLST